MRADTELKEALSEQQNNGPEHHMEPTKGGPTRPQALWPLRGEAAVSAQRLPGPYWLTFGFAASSQYDVVLTLFDMQTFIAEHIV